MPRTSPPTAEQRAQALAHYQTIHDLNRIQLAVRGVKTYTEQVVANQRQAAAQAVTRIFSGQHHSPSSSSTDTDTRTEAERRAQNPRFWSSAQKKRCNDANFNPTLPGQPGYEVCPATLRMQAKHDKKHPDHTNSGEARITDPQPIPPGQSPPPGMPPGIVPPPATIAGLPVSSILLYGVGGAVVLAMVLA